MVKNGDRPQKVTELAESLGFDPVLLGMLPPSIKLCSSRRRVFVAVEIALFPVYPPPSPSSLFVCLLMLRFRTLVSSDLENGVVTACSMTKAIMCLRMRHLAAMGHLVETGEDEYKTTNFIKSLTVSHIWPWYSLM